MKEFIGLFKELSNVKLNTRPLFISLEGGEGAGKNTQKYFIEKLIQYNDIPLMGNKYSEVVMGREPTNYSKAGKKFNFNLNNDVSMSSEEQTKLVVQDREEHCHIIKKDISIGRFYISDRFLDSTFAYQVLKGMDLKQIVHMHKEKKILIPDITIYISVNGDESLRRTKNRIIKDSFDSDKNLILNLDQAYKRWFEKTQEYFPGRHIILVDGNKSVDEVKTEIFEKLVETIKNDYSFFKNI